MQPIQLQLERRLIDGLFLAARREPLDAALTEMGTFVTGHPGFVLFAGHVMRVIGSQAALVGRDGPVAAEDATIIPDCVLRGIGLEWVRVTDAQPAGRRAVTGALILRAGLLARILDRSYRHLEPRESGGQKILQHQLVRACFVESFALAERVRQEAVHFLDGGVKAVDLHAMHRSLSSMTMKASKLMGGHGYLLGETNSIEFLSLCIACQSGQTKAGNQLGEIEPCR